MKKNADVKSLKLEKLSLDDDSLDNEFRLLTGKLQKFWTNHSKNRNQVKSEQHRLMWARASSALNELLLIEREIDGERLFHKLVAFCILMSGLGSPRSEAVVKGTFPALQSVVKKTDVTKLTDLGRSEREQHLLELVQIVMGIRLFNKDCCKGGEGIDDLPELLTKAVKAAKLQHQTSTESIQKRVNALLSAIKKLYHFDEREGLVLVPDLPAPCTVNDLDRLKSALCLFWTQHFYLRDLLNELVMSEQNITTCVEQLRETLVQLHETVRYRAAIPTIQVYPLFVQLSLVWRELQYEAAVLSHLSQILKAVASISDDFEVPLEYLAEKAVDSISNAPIMQLNGFCPWTLIQTGGILLPGVYKDDIFMFRSSEAAEEFRNNPNSYRLIQTVLNSLPELQSFFKIDSEISSEPVNGTIGTPVLTSEAEVQTEIHPVEWHIDENYSWSEWHLKKKCVKLAKLVEKSTKSQQTVLSSFRINRSI